MIDEPMVRADAVEVEITAEGDLHLSSRVAERFFPAGALVAMSRDQELWLLPLVGPEHGGLLLKHRNSRGDRSALIRESLPTGSPTGRRLAVWDAQNGALRVDLRP